MQVELLLAYDDNTWDTEIVKVPDIIRRAPVEHHAGLIQEWANMELSREERYRKVVLFAIYNLSQDEDED